MASPVNLQRSDLFDFFTHHLNKIYAAKTHLLKRLPEMLYETHLPELEEGIFETIRIVEKQRERMKDIYGILGRGIDDLSSFNGLLGLIDDSFADIKKHSDNHELRDMSILFYLTNIESMEMASFQVLQLLAVKMNDPEISRLLKENYDDAQADKTLMLFITASYISNT